MWSCFSFFFRLFAGPAQAQRIRWCGWNDARAAGYTIPYFPSSTATQVLGNSGSAKNGFTWPAPNAFGGGSRFLVAGRWAGNTTKSPRQSKLFWWVSRDRSLQQTLDLLSSCARLLGIQNSHSAQPPRGAIMRSQHDSKGPKSGGSKSAHLVHDMFI